MQSNNFARQFIKSLATALVVTACGPNAEDLPGTAFKLQLGQHGNTASGKANLELLVSAPSDSEQQQEIVVLPAADDDAIASQWPSSDAASETEPNLEASSPESIIDLNPTEPSPDPSEPTPADGDVTDEPASAGPEVVVVPGGEPLPELPLPGEGEEEEEDEEMGLCQKSFSTKLSRVHLTGAHQALHITTGSPLYLKVTGNQNHLSATVPAGTALSGVCVFLAGNQAKFDLSVLGHLGKLVIIGRGNQAKAEIIVDQGAQIDHFAADLKGNKGVVDVSGPGSYTCPSSRKGSVACQ